MEAGTEGSGGRELEQTKPSGGEGSYGCRPPHSPPPAACGSTDIDNEHEGGVDSELCSTHHRRKLEAPV